MTEEIQPRWVIRRDGSAHEVLTQDGTWGTIEHAMWFDTHEEAVAAECPRGTTGTAVQQHPEAAGA